MTQQETKNTSIRVALCSDLHLEFSDIDLKNDGNADVLILSGDIMIANDLHDHKPILSDSEFDLGIYKFQGHRQEAAARFRNFLARINGEFPHTVYVAGNHEFYNGKFFASIDHLKEECSKYANIHFLERDTVYINDVLFVGGTLWTDCNNRDPLTLHAVRDMMSDYSVIRNDYANYRTLKPLDTVERHERTRQYIQQVIENEREKSGDQSRVVVVGHHAPCALSIDPMYVSQYLMNGAYYSDLSEFILDHPQIKLWTMGHTHHVHRYYIGDTLVACNPRGYARYESIANDFRLKYLDLNNLPNKDDVATDKEWNNN